LLARFPNTIRGLIPIFQIVILVIIGYYQYNITGAYFLAITKGVSMQTILIILIILILLGIIPARRRYGNSSLLGLLLVILLIGYLLGWF
jgi:hypothetical protein